MNDARTASMLNDHDASWASDDPDRVPAFFAASCVVEDLACEARFEGQEGVRAFARLTYGGVPDLQVEPTHMVVTGSSPAASWVMGGTHAGDLPGLPATGRAFRLRASSIIRLEAGRILEMLDDWNPLSCQRQVGLA